MGVVSSFFAKSASLFSSIDLRSPGCMFIESCAIQIVQWASRPCKVRQTFAHAHLVNSLALTPYLWDQPINTKPQILAHWLHHRSLYYTFLVVNSLVFLVFPVMSLELHLNTYVFPHTHVFLLIWMWLLRTSYALVGPISTFQMRNPHRKLRVLIGS